LDALRSVTYCRQGLHGDPAGAFSLMVVLISGWKPLIANVSTETIFVVCLLLSESGPYRFSFYANDRGSLLMFMSSAMARLPSFGLNLCGWMEVGAFAPMNCSTFSEPFEQNRTKLLTAWRGLL